MKPGRQARTGPGGRGRLHSAARSRLEEAPRKELWTLGALRRRQPEQELEPCELRAGAVVIGEDLGVFEGWVQQYLAGRGVAGTSILWFEKDGHDPRPPESYRQLCLTSVTTHDLPPTAGYLAGDHVRLRSELGLLERDLDAELAEAEQERDAVLQLARDRGLLPPADPDDTEQDVADPQTVEALHRLIAASPSALLAVSLVDAVGERRSQNQPGTTDEYPNWRIPLADGRGRAVLLDDLAGSDRFAALAAAVRG